VRDDQVRRYARHILLPDVGGLGQTALLVATARLDLRESEPEAELIAASYLIAGGVGSVVVRGASDAQLATLASLAGDTQLARTGDGQEVALQPKPGWWPSAAGDATALAFWRGGLAATRWMADIANT
jgi:hypothetical protein